MGHLPLKTLSGGGLGEGSFTGDPEGYVEEGSGDVHLFHGGPTGEPGRGFIYRGL